MRSLWGTSALAAALGTAAAGPAQAQQAPDSEPITVTATRTAQAAFAVPNVVTVIDAEEIEANLAADIKDLIRFEPGVTVPTAPARFTAAFAPTGRDGNSGFNIRGLGGNRVLFQVDGVRVPEGFTFGPASFGRGDYVDLDLLQSVEIFRGPGSALYGSDGLAGVVSFITRDPTDFLEDDESFAARARVSYASADDSWAENVIAAGEWGAWSALIGYTRRDGHEQETHGDIDTPDSRRTVANPQDIEANAVMGRLVFQPSDAHRLRFTADYGDRSTVTEGLSARAVLPEPGDPPLAPTAVIDLDGLDESEQRRMTLDYTYESDGGLVDDAFVAVYYQQSSLLQFSDEDRFTAADRTRTTTFDNDIWGVAAQLQSRFSTGAVEHTLIYGGDYHVTRQEGLRDGTVPPIGESFPTRPFPNTDFTQTGFFIQDQIDVMDGRISFFPALRYDSYELEPEADALYPLPAAGQSDSRVTPRFGVVAWPTERVGVYFNYAEGFRAPSPSEVNNGFANPIQGYTSIPNPDLKPETSEALELGVRWRDTTLLGAEVRAQAGAFASWYDDFIEQVQFGNFGDPAVFQFINLDEVSIWGLEGRADLNWENGFGLTVAASYAEGESFNGFTHDPLESIEPWRIVAGVSYDAPGGSWGGQIVATHSSEKDDSDTVAAFIPDGFTILDVTAYWRLTDRATLRAGVFNVTDEKYWWWNDVRGVTSAVDAYTQPGLNFSASIAYRF